MFIGNLRKFIGYFGKGRKIRLLGFFILSLIAGLFEFIGIALVYPFVLLIINPQSVINSSYYIKFSEIFQIKDALVGSFIIGLFVVLLFILKNIFMICVVYLQNKFANNWKFDISRKFMEYYLFAPYKMALKTQPAQKLYTLNFLIPQSLDGFVFRAVNFATNFIIVAMILLLLFIKFPFAALVTTVFVGLSLFIQSAFFKNKMKKLSKKLLEVSLESNSQVLNNINNLKELKILSSENYFYEQYLKTQKEFNKAVFQNNFFASIPPYIVEILVVVSLLILAAIISVQTAQNSSVMIASYAITVAAIFRIAPALNKIQTSLNAMNASREVVRGLITEYEHCDFSSVEKKSDLKIDFKDKIELKNIDFSYSENRKVIKNLSLEIKKGEFIGIIGLSGVGKSTLADIIMGLLPVDAGEIKVDGITLNSENFVALRKIIGYVPQQINILDGTFKQNVAWGVNESDIDDKRVLEVLERAKLIDLVGEFEEGIDSKITSGLRGMSQGQKQRLAIARAIYRNPQVLIFDEATSALDVETEHEITKMLNDLKGEKTIIAIAHRLSTLKSCDRLVYLKNGEVVATGSFSELSKKFPDFENLVKLSNI
ncbi:MAG TPA: ABC transporter ATP-binding protein [Candidatus Gastranaerophilaceae bacterium]|nr:ABC transporter ATP-binding protein [Candidatus Gastranaerophilaceae bacterium]